VCRPLRGGQVTTCRLTTEHSHHRVVAGTHGGDVLGDGLHAIGHGRVVLAHDALAVAGIHVAHLDTTGAVAASAVGTTHEQLTGLLGLEQALACGSVELRWDVVGHFYGTTNLFARQLGLDAVTECGPLGGGHESLEAEFLIAKLERLAALGDILLLGGQVRHSLYTSRNSLRLSVLDTCVERLAILTDIEQNHASEFEILATQTRIDCPCALLALLRLRLADNFAARFGHCEFFGRETSCCGGLFLVKDECTGSHLLFTEKVYFWTTVLRFLVSPSPMSNFYSKLKYSLAHF